MSEKEVTQEPEEKKNLNFDLEEWQRKNSAYLEQRAREKEQNEEQIEVTVSSEVALDEVEKIDEVFETESFQDVIDSDAQIDEEQRELKAEDVVEDLSRKFIIAKSDRISQKKKKRYHSQEKNIVFYKMLPVLVASLFLLLCFVYFISPLSMLKTVNVSGNEKVSTNDILAASGLTKQDYTVTTLINQSKVANNVVSKLLWVESATMDYQFPTTFTIHVVEHSVIGYVKDGQIFYPVLSSGEVLEQALSEAELPSQYVLFQLTDLELIKQFVLDLKQYDLLFLSNRISRVELTPTHATEDLLTLTMLEGHTVLVPLSELGKKMAYYDRIASQLSSASVIDMEAGIYTYAK